MIYSRFDQSRGVYDYFVDERTQAVNGDLPVPRLGAAVSGIGTPALEAGRPLPAGVKRAGQGWHAVGLVVRTVEPAGMLGEVTFDSATTWVKEGGWKWLLAGVAAIWVAKRVL